MKTIFSILLCLAFCTAVHAADPVIPDPKLTPGVIMTNVTVEQICTKGYANIFNGGVRHVPESEKRQVFVAYFGKVPANPAAYEIDHLISLELGGANDIKNLWPQSYTGPWNARVKDRLENWLAADVRHVLAAQGHDAATARLKLHQQEVAANWTNTYVKYLGQPDKSKITHGKATE